MAGELSVSESKTDGNILPPPLSLDFHAAFFDIINYCDIKEIGV